MDMVSFVTGGMTILIACVFYSIGTEEEELEMEIMEPDTGLVVTEGSRKLYTMYCENCRKQKRHREIAERVFECSRCKRPTDLRIS
jgi:hypothetical protein